MAGGEVQRWRKQQLLDMPHQVSGAREVVGDVCVSIRRLGLETYTVGRLLWRGGVRTRGQYKLIERNSQDLATLVPFTVVAVMPGGFFILPVLVKLFPNFVPSVFRGKNYKSEKVLVLTQVRRQLTDPLKAALLRPAMVKDPALRSLIETVFASANTPVHVDVAMTTAARQLEDNVTMDGLEPALRDLTAFFGCAAWTQWGRRRKLTSLMRYMRRDDELLWEQGVGQCSMEELVECCSQRGLRVVNMTRPELIAQLEEWHAAAQTMRNSDPAALCSLAVLMFYRNMKLSDERHIEAPKQQ